MGKNKNGNCTYSSTDGICGTHSTYNGACKNGPAPKSEHGKAGIGNLPSLRGKTGKGK
jgi:hypothetical protein